MNSDLIIVLSAEFLPPAFFPPPIPPSPSIPLVFSFSLNSLFLASRIFSLLVSLSNIAVTADFSFLTGNTFSRNLENYLNLLIADTQAVTELKKAGVTIIASHCHEAALIMNLDTVDGIIGDFDGEDWSLLLIENVPGIQDSILSCSEEY